MRAERRRDVRQGAPDHLRAVLDAALIARGEPQRIGIRRLHVMERVAEVTFITRMLPTTV